MKFDLNELVKAVKLQLSQENATTTDIHNLLLLDEGYSQDSPISTGKRLIVDKLFFAGVKPYGETDFEFSHEFMDGINLLIASNLKGKSSVFKIIKFALTGKKPDNIKKWIKQVLLNFRINNVPYSVYIDVSKYAMVGKLINGKVPSVSSAIEAKSIWEANSADSYERGINDFFFNQFSYYNLQWTQKSSKKDSNDLNVSNTSWATYFSSIYLESRDSYNFYGAQNTKTFEMLMGLEYTYPINRLKIKLDKLKNEKTKTQALVNSNISLIKKLEGQIIQKKQEYDTLVKLRNTPRKSVDSTKLYTEYNRLTKLVKEELKRTSLLDRTINAFNKKESELDSEIEELKVYLRKTQNEKDAKDRKRIELKEYLNSKSFFSNLEIHHCPNCNHTVSNKRKSQQKDEHTCLLCSEPLSEMESSKDNIQSKIVEINKLFPYFDSQLTLIRQEIKQKDEQRNKIKSQAKSINTTSSIDIELTLVTIKELESQINELANTIDPVSLSEEEIRIIRDIAYIEGQLTALCPNSNDISSKYEMQIRIIDCAIEELKKQRHERNLSLIGDLRSLMLSEIERFGLGNISDIKFSEDMLISYVQHSEIKKFDEFVEGEQLRLKFAFYLSLIKLDVNKNYGRHTRFLIIDSPTKEEADDEYFGGFVTELKEIQTSLGDKLQILIGTANRSFENQFTNQLVIPRGEYVF